MSNFDEEWRSRFQRFGQGYDADHRVSGWSKVGLQRRLSLFTQLLAEQNLQNSSKILDVGCGAGTYVRLLRGKGYNVIGLDYSFPSLQRARAADFQKSGIYLEGDAYCLPFPDEIFDLVISIGTFQAMGDPQRAVKEMVRVLRPNGLVVVECLNGRGITSLVTTMMQKVRGTAPGVRTYTPKHLEGWLSIFGVTLVKQEGVYLPPRGLTLFRRLFDLRVTNFILTGSGWLSLLLAHAFLLVGKKTGINQ